MSLLEPRSACRHGVQNCGLPIFEVKRDAKLDEWDVVAFSVSIFWCPGCIDDRKEALARAVFDEVCRRLAP